MVIRRAGFAALITVAFAIAANAQQTQGWRTPDGGIYYGIAPPPGSVKIEPKGRPTPDRRFAAPTAAPARVEPTPRPEATLRPTRAPTAEPPPTATSTPRRTTVPTVRPTTVPTVRPTAIPTVRPTTVPTARPTATARPLPTPKPTEEPTPVPTVRPAPVRSPHREPTAVAPPEASGPACGDYVAIHDTRATIDSETDRVKMVGEVMVAGAAVEGLSVCMGGNCVVVDGGKRMANGESARFSVAARGRPGAFTVKCRVVH